MDATQIPEGTTLLIAGAKVLLPGADWHMPGTADIAIGGDRILGTADRFEARPGEAPPETLYAFGHLVMPGFVNAHYHSHDVLAKGTLEEVPLEQWRLYALPAALGGRSAGTDHAGRAGVPSQRHDHRAGHADPLPLRSGAFGHRDPDL